MQSHPLTHTHTQHTEKSTREQMYSITVLGNELKHDTWPFCINNEIEKLTPFPLSGSRCCYSIGIIVVFSRFLGHCTMLIPWYCLKHLEYHVNTMVCD